MVMVRFRLHILRPSNLGLLGVPSQSSPRKKRSSEWLQALFKKALQTGYQLRISIIKKKNLSPETLK
jgi:hypothetical protein